MALLTVMPAEPFIVIISLPLDHKIVNLNNFVWVIYHTVF